MKLKIYKQVAACLVALAVVGTTNVTLSSASEVSAEEVTESVITITPDETVNEGSDEDAAQEEAASGVSEEETEEKPVEETEEIPEEPEEEPEKPVIKPIKLKQPAAPKAAPVKNGIKLTWKKVSKAQKYEVYRKKGGSDEKYKLIKTTKRLSYTDKTAKYGVTYFYKVRASAVSQSNKKTYKSAYSDKAICCTYLIDPSKPMVALTFDDGPSQYTDEILDTLEKYQSRATFFELGNRVNQKKATLKRIKKMGCEIGNHSYSHPVLGNASSSTINSQISSTDKNIKAITGEMPTLFRPPYGSVGTNLKKYAGKPMILWSVDTLDWKSRDANKVYQHVMSHVKDGDIILMHDLYSSTEKAVERIVPELKKRGYQMVTVSELAQYRKVKLTAGERYSQMR